MIVDAQNLLDQLGKTRGDGGLLGEIERALRQIDMQQRVEVERLVLQNKPEPPPVWVPNPGPQTDAFHSEADELLYGGSAGGGKTALLVGLALTEHQQSLILRRFRADAEKVARYARDVLGTDKGWNGQALRLRHAHRLVEFGGCENEDDKQRYKGTPHDLVCVGRGTPVLLADGTYQAVENLAVGDMLATLEGPRRLERVYPPQMKPAVRASFCDEHGRVLTTQIQSSAHAVLTGDGWRSADDQAGACVPIGHGVCGSISEWSPGLREAVGTPLLRSNRAWPRTSQLREFAGRCIALAKRACGERRLPGSCFAAFGDRCPETLRLLLSSVLQALRRLFPQAPDLAFAFASTHGEPGARAPSLLRGFRQRCSDGFRPCGARTQSVRVLSNESAAARVWLLQSADVERPTPTDFADGGLGKTPIYTRYTDTYPHPYTTEIRSVAPGLKFSAASVVYERVGSCEVFDLQVEEVRHYITAGGIVNKNCFDELSDFTESQYVFISTWNRSTDPKQRCRIVGATNPPTRPEGMWIVRRWAAWLDPRHPKPAKPGELRWYVSIVENGRERELEVDGRGPHYLPSEPAPVLARSRTFIPAKLIDNPDLADTGYDAVLDTLPADLRAAYRDGKFDTVLRDIPFQVCPAEWVRAAQARWTPEGHAGWCMTAMALDPAGGGSDPAAQVSRHGAWFSKIETLKGPETTDGSKMAAWAVMHRRDGAPLVLDVGGGYASGAIVRLTDNGIPYVKFNGAAASTAKAKDGNGFVNKRAEAFWKLREALDPDQQGGSAVALPPDPELLEELTALTYTLERRGYQIVDKEDLRKKLGRSTNKADVVAMALSEGDRAVQRAVSQGRYTGNSMPQVVRSPRMTNIVNRRK